ncbi:hypothetical protein SAMN05216374_3177 [Tardiphaga sp. OK246]|uniref:hypothetical protein n=1 Tax=Tardiphaga sp. OK246 TaxID=1855307 RepID=UPI000B695612|nr:hypothetical protein [Tardiphaga sp. OK246]SNT32443.1 hypothetical protein SAMN05216374_3177 [Tardiphaga sp. OK246]
MAAPTKDGGRPGKRSILIPSLRSIIDEGNEEIIRQIDAAVTEVVASGVPVDPARVRKWGQAGEKYFARRLLGELLPHAPDRTVMTAPITKAVKKWKRAQPVSGNSTSAKSAKVAKPIITTEMDWIDRERDRWSITKGAMVRGLMAATAFLLLAVTVFQH